MWDRLTPQMLAGLAAALLLAAGVAGFVPGVTQDYRELEWWGNGSRAQLFGLFQVSIAHNLLYLGAGGLGLVLAGTPLRARLCLLVGGIGFLALWVYRLAIEQGSRENVVPIDEAANWLHFGLGVTTLFLAYLAAYEGEARPS